MISPFAASMKNAHLAIVVFAIMVGTCATSQARHWTDIDGNEISARFVRVTDGVVYLKKGTRIVEVPFVKFCEEDQEFIRGVVTKSSKEHDREWEDRKGRKTKATFVRLEDGKVVLLRKNKEAKVSMENLSAKDQEYVTKKMARRAEAELALETPAHLDPPNNLIAGSGGAMGPSGMPSAEQIRAEAERRMKEAKAEHDRRVAETNREVENSMRDAERRMREARQESERRLREAQARSEQIVSTPPTMSPPSFSSRTSPSRDSFAPESFTPAPESTRYSRPQTGVSEVVYVCSGCNRDVPASLGAGESCPHCGVYFEYSEEMDGSKTYAKDYGVRRFAWLVAVIGVGMFRFFFRNVLRIGRN